MDVLVASNIIKRYGDFVAVDNVSFNIKEGEILGLLGPNGAGKTTLINCFVGLYKIDSGNLEIFGKKYDEYPSEIKKNIGFVPQELAIYDDLTAYENLKFIGRLYNLKGNLLKERIDYALDFTGLYDKKNELVSKFSGGMKRRLNIACAILHKPKLLFLDEPTVGIDPQSRKHILDSVIKLNQEGTTIVYTSHYMEEVEQVCSRIIILDHGRVIAKGTKSELKDLISSEDRIVITLSELNYNLVDEINKMQSIKDCVVDDSKLIIVAEKNGKALNSIIEIISSYNIEILSINIEKPTLEGVFLTLTGRSLRD
ncbi:ATP-binding cassette domain-containing protein [Caldicellulosiruptoraceae bacterium PP1]